jgi:hypothetical protein
MDFVIDNAGELVSILAYIVAAASAVAAMTTTKKDDVWIKRIRKLVDMLALNVKGAKTVNREKDERV